MLIKKNDLFDSLKKIAGEKLGGIEQIIVPAKSTFSSNGKTFFKQLTEGVEFELESYRAVDPLKILYYLTRERVFPEEKEIAKRIIAGVKSCDLRALTVLDRALINDDFVDPNYYNWRKNTLIISSDCTDFGDSCHCVLMDGNPYAEENFDLNLSPIDDSFLITVGSKRGDSLLQLIKNYAALIEASPADGEKIAAFREGIKNDLTAHNKTYELEIKNFKEFEYVDSALWSVSSKECVGCGGCTNICPTCYCLILNDETENDKFVKVRSYDSCQYHGYARVAGGGSPRPRMHQRFRNRYLCKLVYMRENFDLFGCTGCGRCIDTCPAKIEFREVVKNINESTLKIAEN